jgi:chromosome partitioning protein
MRVSTANRKGGVGKTSIAGNVAFELAKTHQTILLDLDAQGSLTSWVMNGQEPRYELADVLYERCAIQDAIINLAPGLDLIPTFTDGDLRQYAETQAQADPFAIQSLCEELERAGYVFIVADLPPGMGTFEQSAVAAMDRSLLVMQPEFLSVDGLSGLLDDLKTVLKKRRSNVRYDWLVANGVNAGFRRHGAYLDALGEKWKGFTIHAVPQSAKVAESQAYHEPLTTYAPGENRALPAYRKLAQALVEELYG